MLFDPKDPTIVCRLDHLLRGIFPDSDADRYLLRGPMMRFLDNLSGEKAAYWLAGLDRLSAYPDP